VVSRSYLELVSAGAADELAAAFSAEPLVDDPRVGRVEGRKPLERFVADTAAWLGERDAALEPVAVIANNQRVVREWLVHLNLPRGRWRLPVAVVEEGGAAGLRAVRSYHSMWPIGGGHEVRAPLLNPDPKIQLSGAVADYQRALATGDLDGVLAAYEPTATVREPSGGPYVFTGTDQLREIYRLQFANGGGIPLRHCTATDDGTMCAIEYNVVRWGVTEVPPQAGIAVYVRGATGRLAAGRIYDDVEPPAVSDSSRTEPTTPT